MRDIMSNAIYDAVKKLTKHLKTPSVDWSAFDEELSKIEDINIVDEEYDETILSELIAENCFYHNGVLLVEVIKHFLDNGYDVFAHEGANGEITLSQLCWSSYDKYIIDAAKILLDKCDNREKSNTEALENIVSGLIGSLEWKLPGVWVVDKDYALGNTYEAFYALAQAFEKKSDYKSICSYHGCINKSISKVELVGATSKLKQNQETYEFCEKLILWFDDIPLVVSPYTDFIVNPVYAKENEGNMVDITTYFDKISGSKLIKIEFIDQTTCYFDFENGYRLLFSNYNVEKRVRNGLFELREIKDISIGSLEVDEIFRSKGCTYASHVVKYEEESLVFSCKDGLYIIFPTNSDSKNYKMGIADCSEELLVDYARKFPITNITQVSEFRKKGNIVDLRLACQEGYLYIKTDDFNHLEIMLSKEEFNPNDYLNLSARYEVGVHMDFTLKKPTKFKVGESHDLG